MNSVSGCGGGSVAIYQSQQRSQQLFAKLDVNGDSSIDATELKSLTDSIGEKTSTAIDANALLQVLDTDCDGSVTSTELTDNTRKLFDNLRAQLAGSQAKATASADSAGMDELFASIDTDGDGSISASEFKTGVKHGPGGPPPAGPPPGNDVGRMIASLLEQYGSQSSGSSTSTTLYAAA
jgi:Ca2+-binding EF-hand superfamily protein